MSYNFVKKREVEFESFRLHHNFDALEIFRFPCFSLILRNDIKATKITFHQETRPPRRLALIAYVKSVLKSLRYPPPRICLKNAATGVLGVGLLACHRLFSVMCYINEIYSAAFVRTYCCNLALWYLERCATCWDGSRKLCVPCTVYASLSHGLFEVTSQL